MTDTRCPDTTLFRSCRWRLSLASSAPEGRAAAIARPAHRRTAGAWLALAPVHAPLLAEIAKLAVRTGIIAQSRSARQNRGVKHLANCIDQPPKPRRADPAARAVRTDARQVQRLAHIDIAEPGNDSLIKQKRLHRSLSARERSRQDRKSGV